MIRTTRGPRAVGGLVALLLALLATAVLGVATAAALASFPVSATGDVWFQADHAAFRHESGGVIEEYYFRITNNQLRFEETDDGVYESNVFVRLDFRDVEGEKVAEASHQFRFMVADEVQAASADHAQLLLLREALDPRTHSVKIEVEDLNARKRGLLYLFTGKRRNGHAEGILELPGLLDQEFVLSDLQFAWYVNPADSTSFFAKSGYDVVPNPSRSYGLLQPRLSAYYEVYDRREGAERPRVYELRHEILDYEGRVGAVAADTVAADTGDWVHVVRFDLANLGHGAYRLRTTATDLSDGTRTVREREFSLIWRSGSWDRTEQDILDEARVLFTEDEYDQFESMSAGDRELHLEQFWAQADPSPGTVRNELREEFFRRVAHANRHFSQARRGMLTDRGRIYIRFGDPDEVERELVPTQDRQLDGLVGILEDENPQGRLLATNDEIDTRAWEIWSYTRQGYPLFPEREFTTPVTGFRFVFVDETGTGSYVLRYWSDFINY